MKTVTFRYVRHGRTLYNRDQVIQGGGVDSPLDPEGLPALRATRDALRPLPFAACYASPLPRALATAEVVLGGRDPEAQPLDDLREVAFGTLDGQPYEGRRRDFVRCFLRQDFTRFGGERAVDVRARVRRAFALMCGAASDGDEVLVVGHGAYLRYVLQEFSRVPQPLRTVRSEALRVPNGSVTTLVARDGRCSLVQMALAPERLAGLAPHPRS